MVAAKLDLIGDNSVEIGADYNRSISVCNQPDLKLYTGLCHLRNAKDEIVLRPVIEVQTPTTFSINISALNSETLRTITGELFYDVLFIKTNHRFFSVRGKLTTVPTITRQP